MEFIARAGSMMERSHRIAGLTLLVCIIEAVAIVSLLRSNAALTDQVARLSNQRQVYVVPGSQAGFYSPTRPEMLLTNFSEYIVQSLNTYTHTNLDKQYTEVQKFFTPKMLLRADAYYKERIREARQDEHSALFVVDRTSVKVSPVSAPEGGMPGANFFEVSLDGRRQNIIGGNVIAGTDLQIRMVMEQSYVSKTNPWGFKVASYTERVAN